ncbi:YqiA/YcfP family alpha/beta fold hydrolase [Chitinivibrio alkaliphilus]|uniref:Putative esterase n=1 Tax=Chitinivibrio alkaliphilus ACht1 TaxID=1313304 RepID=U7DAS9_9BACT|nr:YqiA/YcfP family alpha/beta fold hydrolase [Chitinivibrio alkaliphilus]ERP38678.1 putative esterase [Chitinivibrio alkaliphilus ACht1]
MILYIHGFASSGTGYKSSLFRSHYEGREPFLSPTLSVVPDLAMHTLRDLIDTLKPEHPIGLIGSSLGGFYARIISHEYGLPAVLINPALAPHTLLRHHAQQVRHYYDGSRFYVEESHLQALSHMAQQTGHDDSAILVFQKKGDEILNYRTVQNTFSPEQLVLEEGGDHGFSDISRHFSHIDGFFAEASSRS